MIDLQKNYGHTYRITLDEAATVRGRPPLVSTDPMQVRPHLHRRPPDARRCSRPPHLGQVGLQGVRVHQRGDAEVSVVFPPEAFPAVAELLRARKRRKVSVEQAKAGAQRLAAYRVVKAAG